MSMSAAFPPRRVPVWLKGLCVALMSLSFMAEQAMLPKWFKGFGVIVIGIAALVWLIRVDWDILPLYGDFFALQLLPVAGTLFFSLCIWLVEKSPPEFILRGLYKLLVQLVNICAVMASVYLFEEDAPRCTLVSMCAAYAVIAVRALLHFGPAASWASFVQFGLRFGRAAGAMSWLETHDLTFAFGYLLLYYCFAPKNEPARAWGRALCLLICLLGFKRIGALGVLLASLFGLFLRRCRWDTRRELLRAAGWLLFFGGALYLWLTHLGLFEWILTELGINMMGRADFYRYFRSHYTMSPAFAGHGIDYVYKLLSDLRATKAAEYIGTTALHNDFLRQYIELGFWGYLFWSGYEFLLRPRWLRTHYGAEAGELGMLLTIYAFCTYLTDNTVYYYQCLYVLRLLLLSAAARGTFTQNRHNFKIY